MTHGEIYPAHVLFDEAGTINGVLDWTTARSDDPVFSTGSFGVWHKFREPVTRCSC